MPIVTIDWLEGRSEDQKAAVAAGVTSLLAEVGEIDPAAICVRFLDSKPQDWAFGGELQKPGQ